MKPTLQKIFLLIIFLLVQNIYAENLQITGKEAGFDLRYEYNRSLLYSLDFSALGALELNNLYTFRGGVSLGALGGELDIKTFTQGRIGPLFGNLLSFSAAYIYNGLPAYEFHMHTLLPVVSVDTRWAGIAVGPGFRFARFFGESALFESVLSFSAYVNFISNDKLVVGIRIANFSDFIAGNMGSYSIRVNSLLAINDQWSIINDIELLQSGSVGLSANFYGIAYRGGFRFSW